MLAGSLIAVESAADVDLPRLTVSVLVTLAIYWLAHTYSELVALRIEQRRRPRRGQVWEVIRHEAAIVAASFDPLAVILVARALGTSERTAVRAGLYSIVLLLAGWALLAGRRSGQRRLELVAHVVAGTAFGCAVVLLEVLLH